MTNTEVSYTLQELAILLRARLEGDPSHRISAVADLESAEACEVTFLANPRYEGLVEKTKAGAIVMASTQARIT
ncbi:MAG TPA: LpxD N-terminal domain-containing protein, partial [Chlamydiales bacterium]|nr:LpxD N-terminal domain-containing protein [Chlamydiales bacterium]